MLEAFAPEAAVCLLSVPCPELDEANSIFFISRYISHCSPKKTCQRSFTILCDDEDFETEIEHRFNGQPPKVIQQNECSFQLLLF